MAYYYWNFSKIEARKHEQDIYQTIANCKNENFNDIMISLSSKYINNSLFYIAWKYNLYDFMNYYRQNYYLSLRIIQYFNPQRQPLYNQKNKEYLNILYEFILFDLV